VTSALRRSPGSGSAAATIREVTTRQVRAGYRRPFGISSGSSPELVSLVVEVTSDQNQLVGRGEVSAMTAYTGETVEGIEAAVRQHLAPALVGHDVFNLVRAHETMDGVLRGQSLAKAAIDIALHDLAGRLLDLPVHYLLGGRVRERVETAWVIGLGDVAAVVDEAVEHVELGYRHVKVKGGEDAGRDVELVRRLRASLPTSVDLCLDANEGYRSSAALQALLELEQAGLDLIEQPVPRWDLPTLARLRSRLAVPVMADESVQSLHDALAVVRADACDVLNIKVSKVGGLHRARQIAAVAEAAGVDVKLGSMPELAVGTLAALHLAASLPGATVPADLVGPFMVVADPLDPDHLLECRRGHVDVPAGPGLGLK
jgi:L-alanine-DL-glutamate epimerase-like enolase superfamily enzyme